MAQFLCTLNPFNRALLSLLLCITNKGLARYLSLLDAALTKKTTGGGLRLGPIAPALLVAEERSLRSRNAL